MINVTRIVCGPLRQNCYIVSDQHHQALIIDPGDDFEIIDQALKDQQLIPKAIMNTHGHFDHIGAVQALAEKYQLPFYIHENDFKLTQQANHYTLLFRAKKPIKIPAEAQPLNNIDALTVFKDHPISWIETPGHTQGGVCIMIDHNIFTGDTLMTSGAGRTDLPGGDQQQLQQSLQLLYQQADSLTAYPGHGRDFLLKDAKWPEDIPC